ncbi:hypothetical protein BKA66DRAFT_573518 [Pyrenochaeta sp. MPI-SDFR-AT-0127]|nr:hypothetical protein BKA66DRAFT_573518 [Pyrenochaeta sp. MPI-SDFR-AT-0127]
MTSVTGRTTSFSCSVIVSLLNQACDCHPLAIHFVLPCALPSSSEPIIIHQLLFEPQDHQTTQINRRSSDLPLSSNRILAKPSVVGTLEPIMSTKEEEKGGSCTAADDPLSADALGEKPGFSTYTRIFKYASFVDYSLQGVAISAAIVSGAGITPQNLIFGELINVLTRYTAGESDPNKFREDVAHLAL